MGFQTQQQQDELMSDAMNHTLQLGGHHAFYDTSNSPPMVLLGDTPVERYTSASPSSHFQAQSLDRGQDPALHPSPLHYRTNFKEGGYVPPKVEIQPSKQPEIRQEQDGIYRRRGQFDSYGGLGPPHMMDPSDPDMPFDVLNEILRSNSSQTSSSSIPNPSNIDVLQEWQESEPGDVLLSRQHDSCRRASPPSELDPDMGRFTMGAPKYSDPSPFLIDEVDGRHIAGRSLGPRLVQKPTIVDTHIEIPSPEQKSGSDYEEFGLSPPSSVTDTVVDEAEAALLLSQLPRKSHDDDSLFENLEDDKVAVAMAAAKNKPQGQKKSRKLRVPSPLYRNVDGDDTSLEEVPNVKVNSPKTLQERAAQAWAVRREKNAALLAKKEKDEKVKVEKESEEFPHDEIIKKAAKAGVSFGKADTVHHYQPEPDQDEENTCFTDEDRSLNSEYTKTLESEVEDVIKDILMIGDGKSSKPGRRKFKHKHSVKRKLKSRQKSMEREDNSIPRDDADTTLKDEDAVAISRYRVQSNAGSSQVTTEDDDDDTLETDDKQRSVLGPKSESSTNTQPGDDAGEDPLQLVYGLVEGGMNAMSSALGLFASEGAKGGDLTKERTSKARSKRDSSLSKEVSAKYVNVEPSQFAESCTNDIAPFLKKERSSPSQCQPMSESEKSKSMKEFVNYAQDLLYGPLVENLTGESAVSSTKCSAFFEVDVHEFVSLTILSPSVGCARVRLKFQDRGLPSLTNLVCLRKGGRPPESRSLPRILKRIQNWSNWLGMLLGRTTSSKEFRMTNPVPLIYTQTSNSVWLSSSYPLVVSVGFLVCLIHSLLFFH